MYGLNKSKFVLYFVYTFIRLETLKALFRKSLTSELITDCERQYYGS